MKTVYIDFKWNGGKKEKCKPFVATVIAEYLNGGIQVASGDFYRAIADRSKNTTYIATL